MIDLMPVTAARRLGHYGKVLFCGGLTVALLFYMPAGRENRTWHSTSLRYSKLGSASEARVEQAEVYISPEGMFNPEVPRDRPLDIVLAYFRGNVSHWNRPRTVLQEHQPFWIMYR